MPGPSTARTKLVCTIGPASVERARELVDAGMSVARVNFSHGTAEEQKQAVHAVRGAAHQARRSVAVMIDLPGPKVRLEDLPSGELELEAGQAFELRTNRPTLANEVQPGDRILLADGAVELVVVASTDEQRQPSDEPVAEVPTEEPAAEVPTVEPVAEEPVAEGPTEEPAAEVPTEEPVPEAQPEEDDTAGHAVEPATTRPAATTAVATEVVRGGLIRSRAGVNVPTERLADGSLTDEDREAIPRALELRADMVAQSFVRSAADVRALRELLPQPGPLIVAKIETRAAVDNFDEILEVADVVMVARGDLGVDMPYEEVPLVQKDLVRRAQARGRPTIVATQMLESMTSARRPTRAEASDVANAVLDGADAVMLSAETAIGLYPVEAAQTMLAICEATERGPAAHVTAPQSSPADDAEAICRAAVALADQQPSVDAIWCFTRTGRTAEILATLRPRVPIAAFTINAIAARRIAVRRGVVPIVLPAAKTREPLADQMAAAARNHRLLGGERSTVVLVTTSTQPTGINRLELHSVG